MRRKELKELKEEAVKAHGVVVRNLLSQKNIQK